MDGLIVCQRDALTDCKATTKHESLAFVDRDESGLLKVGAP
jgi:hypothetical protein